MSFFCIGVISPSAGGPSSLTEGAGLGSLRERFNQCSRVIYVWSISESACTVNGAFPSARLFTITYERRPKPTARRTNSIKPDKNTLLYFAGVVVVVVVVVVEVELGGPLF